MKLTWIADNIEKLLILGGALAFGIYFLTTTMKIDRLEKNLSISEANNVILETANKEQADSIAHLEMLRGVDADAIEKLTQSVQKIAAQEKTTRAKINELERTNSDVKEYLDRPIPDDLRCVYVNCAESGSTDKDGRSDSAAKPDKSR